MFQNIEGVVNNGQPYGKTKIKKLSILITSRNKQFEAKELRKIYVVPQKHIEGRLAM